MNERLNVKDVGATRELVRDLGAHENLVLCHNPGSLHEARP